MMMYALGAIITLKPADRAWFGMADWRPNQIIPGAIKVGSRWQPLSARIVATRAGYFDRVADVTAIEARGYPTMHAAVRAARARIASSAE
jgi:hypothetical protein